MNKYRLYNTIAGWGVFMIAAVTYLLTIEPTASFWDCGEFIASAYKLEVGHPPGAPFFMIIGRVFSLLAFGDVTKVASMINALSALASAFTILFLFWSITHIAKKIIINQHKIQESGFSLAQIIAIIGSGTVGALAYTFSDTFWFSAVEAEVYALSSLFTAAVFWAILKWEDEANQKYANRWLILIAYLMGLSIGVHLLNLLAIPAIVFVYYFKKYETTTKGIITALLISFTALAIVMYGIVQGLVIIASKFELLFVNSFGMPFHSGVFAFIIVLLILITLGLYFTQKKKMVLWNTIILMFSVLVIGYSSFALTVIRSNANPPMDENNPENMFALQSYLDREQYGDRPLIYGEYYDAEVRRNDYGEPIYKHGKAYYFPKGDRYEICDYKTIPQYDASRKTIFPRMFSKQGAHIDAYKNWGRISKEKKPHFGNNLRFFATYQLGFMYFRYFMWNFAGRQNDEQGYGNITRGNWISGIKFLDELRIGNLDQLSETAKKNPGRNKYYFLPLILGILGIFHSFNRNPKDLWVVFLLFFMTGVAIVLYLNQTPYQPRERDYAYAGSFYAFTIWIGLSVMMIYEFLCGVLKPKMASITASIIGVLIPIQMVSQTWDDHDRSGRYTTRDFAANYLNSCAKNAILFTYGDNDTFPLWYAQEVEGIRTDVRVVNLSLLGTDWYIDQMKRKAYDSDTLPISFASEKYIQGKRDWIYMLERHEFLFDEKYQANLYHIEPKYKALYLEFITILESSKFNELHINDFATLKKGHHVISPIQFYSLVTNMAQKTSINKYEFDETKIQNLKLRTDSLASTIASSPVFLKDAMKFLESDAKETKTIQDIADDIEFIPVKKFKIPVNKEKILKNEIVSKEKKDEILSNLYFELNRNGIGKSEMAVLDILANNDWNRPIYFAISIGDENFFGLQDYFRLEGFAYRLVPYKTPKQDRTIGHVDSDILYENLMKKFNWGRLEQKGVLIDEHVKRVISLMTIRENFERLATSLLEKGEKEKAIEVLDKGVSVMPHEKVSFQEEMLPFVENYLIAGNPEKANALGMKLIEICENELRYYASLNSSDQIYVSNDKTRYLYIANQLMEIAKMYKQTQLMEKSLNILHIYGM